MSGIRSNNGWLEAAIAWEVCASLHRQYCKGKDALFTTRQSDFVKHAEDAREYASRGQAPAGAAIVPADATDAMMAAFAKAAAADIDWHGATEVERQEVRDGFGPAYRAMLAAVPVPQPDSVLEDAAFEAVRKKLCALPRYSFVLDDDGLVRRVQDRAGNWIEFDHAHELFDPIAVDAARKQGGA